MASNTVDPLQKFELKHQIIGIYLLVVFFSFSNWSLMKIDIKVEIERVLQDLSIASSNGVC